MKRGSIILVDFDPTIGHEIKKKRPALVVSNNIANEYSNLITVLPITSKKIDRILRTELLLIEKSTGLAKPSKVLADQIRTIDKARVKKIVGQLGQKLMAQVDERIIIHLGLGGIL